MHGRKILNLLFIFNLLSGVRLWGNVNVLTGICLCGSIWINTLLIYFTLYVRDFKLIAHCVYMHVLTNMMVFRMINYLCKACLFVTVK